MTETPHDALFKAAFESPADAAILLRSVLPPGLEKAIAWETLATSRGSFVDPELAGRHSDLLFSAELAGRRVLLYLLIEHQSTSDPDMPLRMLIYLVRIWERFRKDDGDERRPLPAVIPLVVSHAPGGWSAPRTFLEMFDPEVRANPSLAAFVPDLSLLVEDLARYSNDDIKALALAAFPSLAVWVLRDSRDAERLIANLEQWAHAFIEAQRHPQGLVAIEQLMRYFSYLLEEVDLGRVRDKLRALIPEAEAGAVATLAERMLEEGREQGREEGREQGRAEVLAKLLALRFGSVTEAQRAVIAAATPEMLDRYIERVLTAADIDAVLA